MKEGTGKGPVASRCCTAAKKKRAPGEALITTACSYKAARSGKGGGG